VHQLDKNKRLDSIKMHGTTVENNGAALLVQLGHMSEKVRL